MTHQLPTLALFSSLLYPLSAAPGRLDTKFSGDGALKEVRSTAIQKDGKFLACGRTVMGIGATSISNFSVTRFTNSGELDMSFRVSGRVTIGFSPNIDDSYDFYYDAALQKDGKMVMIVYTRGYSSKDFALAGLNPDGSPDLGFGNQGKVVMVIAGNDHGVSVVIQPDGKIVVGGYSYSSVLNRLSLAR